MIEIKIKIEEKAKQEYKDLLGTEMDVSIQELGRNATESEKEVSKFYKNKLEVDKKFQCINKSSKSNKKVIDELINELFSI